ncbi:hypothetical protein IWC96_10020 [Brevundimonas sp. BAL450]|uniref:hypothetical protein n=1 Tax=Brevundimonas sp. BAL450 TaxID=1708162 RepID=UPI0018CA72EC|nr:hypothetical protein [Brevundimonas sp. BAL450]MBG7615614.1 hypothetical protein [Brevundimonas sp. BAL450]
MPTRRKVTKTDLDQSVILLLGFLERNRGEGIFKYPFGYSYPKNCCESVALILTYLLEEKYRLDNVRIIRGSKPCGYEHHFWVMAGDWIYDLTAQQFAGQQPIVGVLSHPFLLDEFPEWALATDRSFVERDEVISLFRYGIIPF